MRQSGVEADGSGNGAEIQAGGLEEAPLDDAFIPGAYEIVPRIRRVSRDDGGSYSSSQFHRPRHNRASPDSVVAGMNAATVPEFFDGAA